MPVISGVMTSAPILLTLTSRCLQRKTTAKLIYKMDLYMVDLILGKMKKQAKSGLYVVPNSVTCPALTLTAVISWMRYAGRSMRRGSAGIGPDGGRSEDPVGPCGADRSGADEKEPGTRPYMAVLFWESAVWHVQQRTRKDFCGCVETVCKGRRPHINKSCNP